MPNIASTNALIAAACCNEVVKIVSGVAPTINNYYAYLGNTVIGISTDTYGMEKKNNCPVCSNKPYNLTVSRKITLQNFIDLLKGHPLKLKNPALLGEDNSYILPSVNRYFLFI